MNSKLRDILEELHNNWLDDDFDPTDPHAAEAEKAIRKAVASEMLEIVGKNEKNPGIRKHIFAETYEGKRNKLRAELRQKIKEWSEEPTNE